VLRPIPQGVRSRMLGNWPCREEKGRFQKEFLTSKTRTATRIAAGSQGQKGSKRRKKDDQGDCCGQGEKNSAAAARLCAGGGKRRGVK